MERRHIGPYQRPKPPKRPQGINSSKIIQKPPIPLHEIEAQARGLMERILESTARKPGRPSVYEQPMSPGERQARRRAGQLQKRGIQEALKIGDAQGKPHEEANTGGYDSAKIDTMFGIRQLELDEEDECLDRGRRRRICPEGWSPESDSKAEPEVIQGIRARGLKAGTEERNRQLFAEDELRKMVGECFTAADKTPSAAWIARHVGNSSVQPHERPSLTLTCNACGEAMEFIEDAVDHLRVDHRKDIDEWFRHLEPPREFRDMGVSITIVIPKKRKPSLDSKG
jgi:hypothetical protein